MSLLRRFGQNTPFDDEDDDADVTAVELATISQTLQLSSGWSVWPTVQQNPALGPLAANVKLSAEARYPAGTWAVIGTNGTIYANPLKLAPAQLWTFVLAHLLAHLGLRHTPTDDPIRLAANEVTANTLIGQLNLGTPPEGFLLPQEDSRTDTDAVYQAWKDQSITLPAVWSSAAGSNTPDLIEIEGADKTADTWAMLLTQGLLQNVQTKLPKLPSRFHYVPWVTVGMSKPRQAIHWFINHFPLLSALAAHFSIVEDPEIIKALDINIAAVIAARMEIFVTPDANLTMAETRFVMAHEMLHVGLLHHKREEERDHFVWNVACDFVINAWLKELGIGEMPRGGLYDPAFAGLSSEQIYDKLIKDVQYVRVLKTFRGAGMGDMLPDDARGVPGKDFPKPVDDMAAELMQEGIEAHMKNGRGLLPAGLLEMVTPTREAAPPWKISLTQWFDSKFEPAAPARSYARSSRRQQATPDIPRPRYGPPQFPDGSGIFGVLLDTSGSMNNALLGKCLGTIAALAQKYRIKSVRLVFCDTQPHDEGFVPIERLNQPMPVKGRGGTRLQPGVDALHEASDFPREAPILIITDGECDMLTIKREHAFLIPERKRLPFEPKGPVFRLS